MCKKPNLPAGSDMKNLLPSLRMNLSSNFAVSLKNSFQSSWFGTSEGMNFSQSGKSCFASLLFPPTVTLIPNHVTKRATHSEKPLEPRQLRVTSRLLRFALPRLPPKVSKLLLFLRMDQWSKTTSH